MIRRSTIWAALALLFAAPCAAASDADSGGESPRYHALLQQQLGFYAVFLPPDYDASAAEDRRYPVCVILHGNGSTELNHGRLADKFGREDWIYIAPRAPHASHRVFLEMDQPGFSAWPSYPKAWGPWGSETFPRHELAHVDLVQNYADWIAKTVADVHQRYRSDGERVVVIGHSEGAAAAVSFAMRHPNHVRGFFAYAGYLAIEPLDAAQAQLLIAHEIFPVVAHAEGDAAVPITESRKLLAFLGRFGVPHRAVLMEGGDHSFGDAPQAAARDFLRSYCCEE